METTSPRHRTGDEQFSSCDPATFRIIGAYFGVYRELSWGFLESVYQRAMLIARQEAGASVKSQVTVPVTFHGRRVGVYRADLIVDDRVIVELKIVERIDDVHRAQLLNYLKATAY